jgi:carboxypeptidase family protein
VARAATPADSHHAVPHLIPTIVRPGGFHLRILPKRGMKPSIQVRFPAVISLFVALLTLLPSVTACVYVLPTIPVGRQFRVQVIDRERKPIPGLRLILTSNEKREEIVVTDRDGSVEFDEQSPGIFWLTAAQNSSGIDSQLQIGVSDGVSERRTVPMQWPGTDPVPVRTLQGTVSNFVTPLSLSLFEGLSARLVQTVETNEHGQFAFADVRPGLYFLGVAARDFPSKLTTGTGDRIAVEVDPSAHEEKLNLDLSWTDCGLDYRNRNKCPLSELAVGNLCGSVIDPLGAVISNADVRLLEDTPQLNSVKQVRTDRKGNFVIQEPPTGKYQLMVQSPGFYALKVPIRLQEAKDLQNCVRPIVVTLGVGGSCSSAVVTEQSGPAGK